MKTFSTKLLTLLFIGVITIASFTFPTTVHAETISQTSSDSYVIVLDPGHSGPGSGTSKDWGDYIIDEATINMKIAEYTKATLEAEYPDLEVYITKSSLYDSIGITNRVKFALEKNADLLVSQHINAHGSGETTANGVLAIVPLVDSSHSYNKEAALLSQALGRNILDKLISLSFIDKGFLYRLSEDNTLYPDGSLADYYGIIRLCRENNLPGIIVEHGFANNRHDADILSQESNLKKIGEADAHGIVEYLMENAGYVPRLFSDVDTTDYFYDAVSWAVENNITYGVSETEFGTGLDCSRAQGISFLWRNEGSPSSDLTTVSFLDVRPTDYFYNAVCWGVQQNIVSGYSEVEFGTKDPLTRAQFVSFLWRLEGCPTPTVSNPFSDISEEEYYYEAILWAYENGITAGTSTTTFSPNDACLREQVISFLYRLSN